MYPLGRARRTQTTFYCGLEASNAFRLQLPVTPQVQDLTPILFGFRRPYGINLLPSLCPLLLTFQINAQISLASQSPQCPIAEEGYCLKGTVAGLLCRLCTAQMCLCKEMEAVDLCIYYDNYPTDGSKVS